MTGETSFVLSDVSYNVGDSIYFDPRVLEEGSTEQTHPHVPGYIAASGRDPKVEEMLHGSWHTSIDDLVFLSGIYSQIKTLCRWLDHEHQNLRSLKGEKSAEKTYAKRDGRVGRGQCICAKILQA